jgi:hypothetical protein
MREHPNYPGYEITMDGKIYSSKREKFLTLSKGKDGYVRVTLYRKKLGKKVEYVHKLVADVYIDNPRDYKLIGHKDENRSNNLVDNLEWRKNNKRPTPNDEINLEQEIDRCKVLLEQHGYTVLTKDQVMNIMKKIRQS